MGIVAICGCVRLEPILFPSSLAEVAVPKSTVLAVDDVEANLELYQRVIRRLPAVRIVSYTSSAAALAWSKKNEFDLLLVDYKMPTPNGLQFVEALRKVPSAADIPIVMVTAFDEKQIRREALALGVNDFLIKPIDALEFLIRVKSLLLLRGRGRYLRDRASWLNEEVARVRAEVAEREEALVGLLKRLTASSDAGGAEHLARVATYAQLVGLALGMSADEARDLRYGALFHDIGMISIPQQILVKAESLTEEERRIVARHPIVGHEILRDSSDGALRLAADIALAHHERWDGTGYPNGLSGESIPLAARIVSLCDVYDALGTAKSYKVAWSFVDAAHYIEQQSGKQFDPGVVTAFRSLLPQLLQIQYKVNERSVGA